MMQKAVLGCCLIAVVGCKSQPAVKAGAEPGTSTSALGPVVPTAAPVDPATLGSVSGVVKVSGKIPVAVKIDTSMDPACGLGGSGDLFSEQYVSKSGGLGNVFVYVKSGPPMITASVGRVTPVVMDQKGCRYVPHVVGVERGGTVEFTNSDPTMHNIHDMATVAGNAVDVSQGPRGAPVTKVFKTPELMIPVRCNNHPWMNAFVNVSATPFFAVTDDSGKFMIEGLPAGTYTLGAVHEKLGEQTVQVTVVAKTAAKAEFGFAMK